MRQQVVHRPPPNNVKAVLSAVTMAVAACASPRPAAEEPVPSALVVYQPFDAAYQGITRRTIQQKFDGQVVTNESGMNFFLQIQLAAAEDFLLASFVIDSVTQVHGLEGPMVRAQIDSARGASFSGSLSSDGMIGDWQGGESAGMIAQQLSDQILSDFFPRLAAGGVEPGFTWSDTVHTTANVGGVENSIEAVRDHRATDWTEFGGQPALEILTDSRYTYGGAGVQVGQEFTIEGTGVRHSSHYLTAGGSYLGTISADTSNAEAEIISAGIVIPVKQIRSDSIIKMP